MHLYIFMITFNLFKWKIIYLYGVSWPELTDQWKYCPGKWSKIQWKTAFLWDKKTIQNSKQMRSSKVQKYPFTKKYCLEAKASEYLASRYLRVHCMFHYLPNYVLIFVTETVVNPKIIFFFYFFFPDIFWNV